jgi:hypothetical protein
MNKDFLYMQFLSGVITESEYKQKLEESKKSESKDSINENFVGIGAINNPFAERERTDYEVAFDHFMGQLDEKKDKPGTAKERSAMAKKARAGKDIGAKGKNFEKIAKSAGKKYGSEEAGKKVAGAVMYGKLKEEEGEDAVDTITMDVPLFIRMLEYAREDASQDVDLHDVTEKAVVLNKDMDVLTMDSYDSIVGAAEDAPAEEEM